MKNRRTAGCYWIATFVLIMLGPGPLEAQEPPAPAGDTPQATADYDKLARELDSRQFSARQTAMRGLKEAGAKAIPALEAAAMSESRERSVRALEILRGHFEEGDEALKAAAKTALETIRQSGPEAAASRAGNILDPPTPAGNRGPVIVGPGQIQIQVQGIAQLGRQVVVRNINGVKTTTVKEGNRKIEIKEDPQNGIEVTAVETKNGKQVTNKYAAKDVDDLKKKHPEGYKLYQQYAGQQQGQAALIQGLRIAPAQLRQRVLPAKNADEARKDVEKALELVKSLEKDVANHAKWEEAVRRLEAAEKSLEKLGR